MGTQVSVLVGTTKGAFLLHSGEAPSGPRSDWRVTGIHLGGWGIDSFHGDPGGRRLFAGTGHYVYGPTIRYSDDLGETWTQVADTPRYPQESGFRLKRIWQIVPGHPSEPGTLYAGVEEAGLFVSRDHGMSWREVESLARHPTRPAWFPGMGGLCLHTLLVHPGNPRRMWAAISAVGVFRTDDGGESWTTRNQGLPIVATDRRDTEVCRCVHKMVLDPRDPDRLYMQFHGGVFRSTDGADSWERVESGLPANFGFPMVITPGGELFVIPLHSDERRYVVDGRLRVYRSGNGGESWEPSDRGLPREPTYVGVLRDAMAVDTLDPPGIYFGTTMGNLFHSADGGETWARLPGQYPRITAVKTWVREA